MNKLVEILEEHGLEVSHIRDNRYFWIKACNKSVKFDAYVLFGMEDDDLMLAIKQRFYQYNIKIDLFVPENNKSTKKSKPIYNSEQESIIQKKKNIRKLLKNKFKLIS